MGAAAEVQHTQLRCCLEQRGQDVACLADGLGQPQLLQAAAAAELLEERCGRCRAPWTLGIQLWLCVLIFIIVIIR